MTVPQRTTYAEAIREAMIYLLGTYPECFCIGQGLWSPWYVGSTMADLDSKFGKERVIDSPVSEWATTGAAVGASLFGYRPIVVHPRLDFMVLATDPIVNQAAKWSHMLGADAAPSVTIRGIVNRGGEQGAQHSQALHAWYAHVPGLRVVMPATAGDARDLLIASVLCDDPVLYIDDRWCYESAEDLPPIVERDLRGEGPKVIRQGTDITLVAASYSTRLCLDAAEALGGMGISVEVIDLRVINPLDRGPIVQSVRRTGALLAVDGGWQTCGLAGEVIASAAEAVEFRRLAAPAATHDLARCAGADQPRSGGRVLYDRGTNSRQSGGDAQGGLTAVLKRVLDVVVSVIGLIVASPVLLPVMALVWRQDFHSPFYIAGRVGKDDRDFKMVKLRSMIVNADYSGVDFDRRGRQPHHRGWPLHPPLQAGRADPVVERAEGRHEHRRPPAECAPRNQSLHGGRTPAAVRPPRHHRFLLHRLLGRGRHPRRQA